MQWSRNMVHSHFTLCLRARDYIQRLSQHPWYGLWMRVKDPHHYKVMALGSCVKWPQGHFTHTHTHTQTASPCPRHFKHSHWWERWSWSKFTSHYPWGTNRVYECKLDVKSTWVPIWHRMDHVSWSLGLPHVLEVGLTQNHEIMALRTLITIGLFYLFMRTYMNRNSLK